MSATLEKARLSYGHAVRAEWLKLTTMRGMWWVAIASVALSLVTVGTSSHAPPEAGAELDWTMSTIASAIVTAWVIVSVYAALQATGEWSSGMYRVTFAVVPRRNLWLAAKATVMGIYAGLVAIVVTAASTAIMMLRYPDESVIDLADVRTWETFIGVPAVCVMTAIMAVGIGALVRSSGIAVVVVVGLLVLLPFAGLFGLDWLAEITAYLPTGAGDSMVQSGAFGATSKDLGVWLGAAVMLAWSAGACIVAAIAMKRRDA